MDNFLRPQKVAFIITRLELGGAQKTVLTLLARLNRSQFSPTLFCGEGEILDAQAKILGVPIVFIPDLVRPLRPWKDFRALWTLTRALRRMEPDIVHTHSSKAGVLGRLAARLAGVPRVAHTVHGFGHTPRQPGWARQILVWIEKWLARGTDALVFVSEANRCEAQKRGIGRPEHYHLIRAAVDLEKFLAISRPSSAPEGGDQGPWASSLLGTERWVTTVGPFKPQKNLVDFIRAAGRVAKQVQDVRFRVVGDGEGRSLLEGEITRLGLENRVVLAGWRQDMDEIFARTDVFCMTSLWEGLPMALVEAMAAGLPSVVNDVNGCREVVKRGETGWLIHPGHPEETAERLIYLLTHPAEAHRMGVRARSSIGREFDLESMVGAHQSLYLKLTGGS